MTAPATLRLAVRPGPTAPGRNQRAFVHQLTVDLDHWRSLCRYMAPVVRALCLVPNATWTLFANADIELEQDDVHQLAVTWHLDGKARAMAEAEELGWW